MTFGVFILSLVTGVIGIAITILQFLADNYGAGREF